MSITRCPVCNKNIDEDYDVEHFDECEQDGITAREIILGKLNKTNNQMKQNNIKEAVEKILDKYNVETIKLIGLNDPSTMYVKEESTGLIEELTTLIDKVREEAVISFWEYLKKIPLVIGVDADLDEDKQYLQSIKEQEK